MRDDGKTGFVIDVPSAINLFIYFINPKRPPISNMFGIPINLPTRLIKIMARTTIKRPIAAVVIFFLADSRACLSPPDPIIPITPRIKVNTNQMIATIVITPIALEMIDARSDTPFPDGLGILFGSVKPPLGAI